MSAVAEKNDTELRRTPLYDAHVRRGAKMVPFAGWEMPVQYSGVIPEHTTVRERVGLFDVSHMGEVFVEGPEAEAALNYMTSNDLRVLRDRRAQYSAIPNEQGGAVDDIIVYRYSPEKFLVCVNASNAEKDFAWFVKHNKHRATFTNRSAEFGQIAVQGPLAIAVASRLPGWSEIGTMTPFSFRELQFQGVTCIVARTGYTGEDGCEISVPAATTTALREELLRLGEPEGILPIGLGARDSLRLEACLPLHGHELGDEVTLIESGLGWIVKPGKDEFIGKEVLAAQKERGAPSALIGLYLDEPGIARHGDRVFSAAGDEIGVVTSGTKTPTLNRALGMALVRKEFSTEKTAISVEIRGKQVKAHVTGRPFYKRSTVKK